MFRHLNDLLVRWAMRKQQTPVRNQGRSAPDRAELLQFFEKASQAKDHLSPDDFRDALLGGMSGGFQPGDAPSPAMLIRGLFAGEIG